MKKSAIFAAVVSLMVAAGSAHAEHKLLVTDVLDAKQVEAQATFEYLHSTRKIEEAGVTLGKARSTAWESNYSLNVGLGHGLEVDASIPYVFSERAKVLDEPTERRDGIGDFVFGLKYALVETTKQQPFGLVIGADIKFDTAGTHNAGTGNTDVSPYIAGSQRATEHLTPYAIYRATISKKGEDFHNLTFGVEAEANETVTVDARFDAIFANGTVNLKASERYSLELSTYLQLCHNFYVIPAVTVASGSPIEVKGTEESLRSPKELRGALSFYYLF